MIRIDIVLNNIGHSSVFIIYRINCCKYALHKRNQLSCALIIVGMDQIDPLDGLNYDNSFVVVMHVNGIAMCERCVLSFSLCLTIFKIFFFNFSLLTLKEKVHTVIGFNVI